jgi:hypothetical protein
MGLGEGVRTGRPRAVRVVGIVVVVLMAHLLAVLVVWALLHLGTWLWPREDSRDAIRSITVAGRL